MVFDHPLKRLALKDREQVKRRKTRELNRLRNEMESERKSRLKGLEAALRSLRSMEAEDRRLVGDLLQKWEDGMSIDEPDVEAVEQLWRTIRQSSTDWDRLIGLAIQQPESTVSLESTNLDILERLAKLDTFEAESEEREPWLEALEDTTSRPFAVAYQIEQFRRGFERSLCRIGEKQSKGQKTLTEYEDKIYQRIATSLPPSPEEVPSDSVIDTLQSQEVQAEQEVPLLSPLTTLNTAFHKTYTRSTTPLPSTVYNDCAHLCTLMSVPVFWTGDGTRSGGGKVHEAEAYASSLVKAGYADVVASEDSDVLLYDTILLRGLVGGIKQGKRMVELIDGSKVRRGFFPLSDVEKVYHAVPPSGGRKTRRPRPASAEKPPLEAEGYEALTKSLMLDFALMCGTDFNRTIPGIGPKTALKLLLQHGTIGNILRAESKFKPPEGLSVKEYESELRDARTVFTNPPKVRAVARSVIGPAPAAEERVGLDHFFEGEVHESEESESIEFDNEPVLEYLRTKGVFARNKDADWRDAMDLELGTVTSDAAPSMGIDFFGEASTARWGVGMEAKLRRHPAREDFLAPSSTP